MIKKLQARVKELEHELQCLKLNSSAAKPAAEKRGKIAEMSSEVVDSNPYRLARSFRSSFRSVTRRRKFDFGSCMSVYWDSDSCHF